MEVAILTFPGDFHAHAVAWGLRKHGHDCDLIFLGDLPQRGNLTVDPSSPNDVLFESSVLSTNLNKYDRIWLRRPADALLPSDIHPSDRRAARQSWDFLKESFLRALGETDTFCVNPPIGADTGRMKSYQLSLAKRVGLSIPKTIITNDSTVAHSFIDSNSLDGRNTIVKGLYGFTWNLEDGGLADFNTERVTKEDVLEQSLKLAPCIFQVEENKLFEVRLTVMGRTMFAAKLDSQQDIKTSLDYRMTSDWSSLGGVPVEIPAMVEKSICDFQDAANLNFGTFDFIVTPNNEWIFLETNPSGQFLWVEDICSETTLLDAFVDFILSGSNTFCYDFTKRACLSLRDFVSSLPDDDNEWVIKERSLHITRKSMTPSDHYFHRIK